MKLRIHNSKAAKRIVETNVNNSNCGNAGSTNKTVIHFP